MRWQVLEIILLRGWLNWGNSLRGVLGVRGNYDLQFKDSYHYTLQGLDRCNLAILPIFQKMLMGNNFSQMVSKTTLIKSFAILLGEKKICGGVLFKFCLHKQQLYRKSLVQVLSCEFSRIFPDVKKWNIHEICKSLHTEAVD